MPRAKDVKCSLVGCKGQQDNYFILPSDSTLRNIWINFIFNNDIPANLPKTLFVCQSHFSTDCFGQYKTNKATRLRLESTSIPTLRDPTAVESVSPVSLSAIK